MASNISRAVLLIIVVSVGTGRVSDEANGKICFIGEIKHGTSLKTSQGLFFPSFWWGDDGSKESTARSGWTPWIEFEDSSEEGDSSVDLEDLVLTISLDGPPKTAKPTTLATTTTDSTTTTKPKPKPPPKG